MITINDIIKLIQQDRVAKRKMLPGCRYYNGEHDILKHRLFYFNSEGELVEDKYRSNIKIAHQFHTELVDQKVQYILSNGISITAESDLLQEQLEQYIDDSFLEVLQATATGASNKGVDYIYAYLGDDDRVHFQHADALGIIEINDTENNLVKIIRYYDYDKTTKVEVWTKDRVEYYQVSKNKLVPDTDQELCIRPHVLFESDNKYYDGGSFDRIPFFKLKNNAQCTSDLDPVKSLIDDYDLMAASLSNNLEDFQDAIYVVRGYQGDNLDTLTQNLKTRKTIGVSDDGGLDVTTIDIPYEARKVKLELDKEAIYKFGMGFDSTQLGDGNITNVVIKSRYSLLDLKCNKIELYLRTLLSEIFEFIISDINRRKNTNFATTDMEFDIERSMLISENDLYTNKKLQADTEATRLGNILAVSSRLSDDTVLQLVCNVLDLDYTEEAQKAEQEILNDSAFDLNRLGDVNEVL